MRCPNCNKFVPFDEPEVEVTSSEVQDTSLDLEARIVLKCADCGEELKDAELSESLQLDELHDCEVEEPEDGDDTDTDRFELEGEVDAEGFDRFEDKDRNGKQIKSMRYMKHSPASAIVAKRLLKSRLRLRRPGLASMN